jgi:hypothetical protein
VSVHPGSTFISVEGEGWMGGPWLATLANLDFQRVTLWRQI